MITIRIPGEPVAKGRPRVVRAGAGVRAITPAATRDWTSYAVGCIQSVYTAPPTEEPVRVIIYAVRSRPKRLQRKSDPDGLIWRPAKPDADNVGKAVLDALTKAGVWRDDAQVVALTIYSLYAERDGAPRVDVVLRDAGAPALPRQEKP